MNQLTVKCYFPRKLAIASGSAKYGEFEFAISSDMLHELSETAKDLLSSDHELERLQVSGIEWGDVRRAIEERAQKRRDEQERLAERFRAVSERPGGVLDLSKPLYQVTAAKEVHELGEQLAGAPADLAEHAQSLMEALAARVVSEYREFVLGADGKLPEPESCWTQDLQPIVALSELLDLRKARRHTKQPECPDPHVPLARTEAALAWRDAELERRQRARVELDLRKAREQEERRKAALDRVVNFFGTEDERHRHLVKGLAPDEIMTIAYTHLFPSLEDTVESYQPIRDSECDCRHYPVYRRVRLIRQPLEGESAQLKRVRDGIDRDATLNKAKGVGMAFSARVELMEQSCYCHGSHEGDTRARRVYLGITIMVDELDLMSRDFTARAAPGEA